MSGPSTGTRIMSRPDAAALALFMIAGVAIAAWTVVVAVARVAEVLQGAPTRVRAEFVGTEALASIGPNGSQVPIELDSAYLLVPELPMAAVVVLVLEQVVLVATVLTVVSCLLLVTASIQRGRVFSRANTRLVGTAGMVGLLGLALVPFFANMGANEAFALLSGGAFEHVVMSVDPFPLVLLAFIAALAGLTFAVGDRLQRDTEGLV